MPVPNYTNFAQHPKRVHFIGISGIGMGALAQLCLDHGWAVQGTTLSPNKMTQTLVAQGASIALYHGAEHIDQSVDCVVYTSAIPDTNPELQAARSANIPVMHRSTLLRAFVEPLRTVAISGTHGKTTTTSLLGHVLYTANKAPLILSGGMMVSWDSPVYSGKGSIAIVEADESDHSHVNFASLYGAIITNIDGDHMENYGGSLDNLWKSFQKFFQLTTDFAVACSDAIDRDNPWFNDMACPITWYGTGKDCDFSAHNIGVTPSGMHFDCHTRTEKWENVHLNLWGHHNVLNSLAIIAACAHMGISQADIRKGLASFPGVSRRLTQVGMRAGVPIIDDYAHHPREISAVLSTLNQRGYRRILAVCQPHRYTRLRDTMDEFATCFHHADTVVLLPVYSAGELPIPGATSKDLGKKLMALGHRVSLIDERDSPKGSIIAIMEKAGWDVAIFLGAGDISQLAYSLAEHQSIE
jgi:UDP-N-acetylmuramate--alanine ligase